MMIDRQQPYFQQIQVGGHDAGTTMMGEKTDLCYGRKPPPLPRQVVTTGRTPTPPPLPTQLSDITNVMDRKPPPPPCKRAKSDLSTRTPPPIPKENGAGEPRTPPPVPRENSEGLKSRTPPPVPRQQTGHSRARENLKSRTPPPVPGVANNINGSSSSRELLKNRAPPPVPGPPKPNNRIDHSAVMKRPTIKRHVRKPSYRIRRMVSGLDAENDETKEDSPRNSSSVDQVESIPDFKAVAAYDFDSSEDGDLPFRKGDIISVVGKVGEDWYSGKLGTKQGIFPQAYVKRMDPDRNEKLKQVMMTAQFVQVFPNARQEAVHTKTQNASIRNLVNENCQESMKRSQLPSPSKLTPTQQPKDDETESSGSDKMIQPPPPIRNELTESKLKTLPPPQVRMRSDSERSDKSVKPPAPPVRIENSSDKSIKPPPPPVRTESSSDKPTKPPPPPVRIENSSDKSIKPPPPPVRTESSSDKPTKPPPPPVRIENSSDKSIKPPPPPVRTESSSDKPIQTESPSSAKDHGTLNIPVAESGIKPNSAIDGAGTKKFPPPPIVSQPNGSALITQATSTGEMVPPPSVSNLCVAKFDFNNEDPSELKFKCGDRIEVITKLDENWWVGRVVGDAKKFEGMFPTNYVTSTAQVSPQMARRSRPTPLDLEENVRSSPFNQYNPPPNANVPPSAGGCGCIVM